MRDQENYAKSMIVSDDKTNPTSLMMATKEVIQEILQLIGPFYIKYVIGVATQVGAWPIFSWAGRGGQMTYFSKNINLLLQLTSTLFI
jgi:hypothetical protein